VRWFLPHYSSEVFRQELFDRFREIDFPIPYDAWFSNLAEKGNTGSASIFIMLDELVQSGPHRRRRSDPVLRAGGARASPPPTRSSPRSDASREPAEVTRAPARR
jgi:3-oxoacyl-[acyl-carrier-protein] synthase III